MLQLAKGGGVKRAGLHSSHSELSNPTGHLLGCFLGERQRQYLVGLIVAGLNSIANAMGDCSSLSGSRTGHDADGGVKSRGDQTLSLV